MLKILNTIVYFLGMTKHKCEPIIMIKLISMPPLSTDSENQRKYFSKGASKGWKSENLDFYMEIKN